MHVHVSNILLSRTQNSLCPDTNNAPWRFYLLVAMFNANFIWIFVPVGVLLQFVLNGDVVAEFLAIQPVVANSVTVALIAAVIIMLVASLIVLTAAFRVDQITQIGVNIFYWLCLSGHNFGNWYFDLCWLYRRFIAFFYFWWDDQQLFDCWFGIADARLSCQVSGCWVRRDIIWGATIARKPNECQPRFRTWLWCEFEANYFAAPQKLIYCWFDAGLC